jgi:hypothetical protein
LTAKTEKSFIEAIAESNRAHHEAWANRPPGDGLGRRSESWMNFTNEPEPLPTPDEPFFDVAKYRSRFVGKGSVE